jgi:hypothetical protein
MCAPALQVAHILHQAALGMTHLHNHNVLHRCSRRVTIVRLGTARMAQACSNQARLLLRLTTLPYP